MPDRLGENKQHFENHNLNPFIPGYIISFLFVDKMIANENLQGIPLLVLANKQDIPDCMGVREVKPIFNKNAHLIGKRDCMVMPISALTG